jgi:hypothetical protein
MKYRYTIDDICQHYSITEAQLIEYVRLGRLIPESWELMDEKIRKLRMADRKLVFTKDRLDVFFSSVLIENLRYHEILETLDIQSRKIDSLSEQIAQVHEMIVIGNQQMSLKAFSKIAPYSIHYLRNKIVKLNDNFGHLKVSGFNLILIKQGKSWTLNYSDYVAQRKKISYDQLKKLDLVEENKV